MICKSWIPEQGSHTWTGHSLRVVSGDISQNEAILTTCKAIRNAWHDVPPHTNLHSYLKYFTMIPLAKGMTENGGVHREWHVPQMHGMIMMAIENARLSPAAFGKGDRLTNVRSAKV